MNRKIRRRRKRIKLMSWSLVLLVGVLAASFAVKGIDKKGKVKEFGNLSYKELVDKLNIPNEF